MAFSLSWHSLSRALGRNGGPFDLFVLVVLIVLFEFIRGISLRAVIAHQKRGDSIQWNNLVCISFKNRGARHAADDASIFALCDGHSTGCFDRAESFGAVISHARHQNSDHGETKLLSHGMKKNIRGWAMSIDGRPIGEHHHVAAWHAPNHDVAIPRTDKNAAGEKQIAGACFLNLQSAALVEALRKHFRKTFRHVLHNNNCGLKIRWNLRQNKLQCVWTAG